MNTFILPFSSPRSRTRLEAAADDPHQVADYLARFGHAVESADPIHPTLGESPEHLAWQLAAAGRTDVDPDERLARTRRQRNAVENAVRAMKGPRGIIARQVLAVGQSYVAHTDDAVFHFQRVLAAIRKTVDGALDATRMIADGTPIVVDGSAGIVEL